MKIDGVEILGGPAFPDVADNNNLFRITDNSQGNVPGLYTRIAGTWARILVDGDDVNIDLDDDLDSIADLVGLNGILRKTGANTWVLDTKTYLESGQPANVKNVSFVSQPTLIGTTGNISVDWSQANHFAQQEPTGAITYSFTAPAGPCHLQLTIASDGTSGVQSFNWPVSVIWYGTQWQQVANKRAIVNFFYDGSNYHAMGVNQA